MGQIRLLDCTLRDGGYINDWNFGHDTIVSVFERIVEANVDIIEVGFLDDRRVFDMNRSIFPDTESIQKIYGDLDRKSTMVVGMIDYGTCDIKNIQPAKDSYLDGIRVIFKKAKREAAMDYCRQLKELGYVVFSQLVSVTSYEDDEMMDLIRLANDVKPYAVSMVDTYGLMHQNNLLHYFDLLNENLDPDIQIGYHGHNNFQMGYANAIAFLEKSKSIDRGLVVDGTLYGMGKSAGNGPIELIAMHMNERYGTNYDVPELLEAIQVNIISIQQEPTWGYNLFYFIAAYNDCHPTYVQELMDMRSLSVKQINEILSRLEGEKKLLYDGEYFQRIFREYLSNDINDDEDRNKLSEVLKDKTILLLGPGSTMAMEHEKIESFIANNHPIVISVNYLPEKDAVDYLFLSNSKRYVQLATKLTRNNQKIIATSNVESLSRPFDYQLNVVHLLDKEAKFIDNSLMMSVKALVGMGVKKLTLAGFDGYEKDRSNYFDASKEYDYAREQADYLNEYISEFLKNKTTGCDIEFITTTKYQYK